MCAYDVECDLLFLMIDQVTRIWKNWTLLYPLRNINFCNDFIVYFAFKTSNSKVQYVAKFRSHLLKGNSQRLIYLIFWLISVKYFCTCSTTSLMAVVTPTNRNKSVRNRCVIEVVVAFGVVTLLFGFFCRCRDFFHRTESDLVLFSLAKETF